MTLLWTAGQSQSTSITFAPLFLETCPHRHQKSFVNLSVPTELKQIYDVATPDFIPRKATDLFSEDIIDVSV